MALLDFLNNRLDNSVRKIGEIETGDLNQTASVLENMMSSMGMANPSTPINSSSKGVTIKKKGNAYVITLNMYNPPITFTWTGLMPDHQLAGVIAKLVEANKTISYINKVKTLNGDSLVQLGIAA